MTTSGAEAGLSEVIESPIESSTASPPTAQAEQPPAQAGFDGLGLSTDILKAVADSGYTQPTPIQAQGIPQVLQRRDV
ncbi:MAG TPA: DEAD/DEAH box helicase, partial [Rhizomicrobium sp.]|nr:DEAD/DEAH box helicase [Rhizomicrobium sp.]